MSHQYPGYAGDGPPPYPGGAPPGPAGYTQPGYPPQQGGYPPQQGGYPPQQGGYPPQQGGYPPQQGGYPPQQGGYPPQQGFGQPGFGPFVPRMDPSQNDAIVTNGDPKEDGAGGFGSSFSNKAIRHAFIRKVYLILTLQLSFTLGIVALFTLHEDTKMWVQRHSWIYWCSYGVFLVTYITIMCCGSVRRKHPWNLILLCLFTAAFTYMVAMISSFYSTYIVLMATGLTAGICLLLTLFAVQTKWDFTGCGMFLCVASLVVMLFGIAALIVGMFTNIGILNLVYAGLIALLFSMYLVYDTQQIVGGRKHEISPEEHIYGAVILYVDIMQIFMALLSLVGSSDS